MKRIYNYKEFMDEFVKGNKKVSVGQDFYEWLKENMAIEDNKDRTNEDEPVGKLFGINIYLVKEI